LQAAARGVAGEALRRVAHDALLAAGCPANAKGEAIWLPELLALLTSMRESELWQRARVAQRVLYEVPFEAHVSADDWKTFTDAKESSTPGVLTGRIDLAFLEADGWVLADYKSDVVPADVLRKRTEHYRRQVDLYAECWRQITGQLVKERRLVFTTPHLPDIVW
jgi:ATP-dependent helicase/nuclease subunit A